MTDAAPTGVAAKLLNIGRRVSLSMIGPLSVAASNFLLSLVLIPHLPAHDYGTFAFVMVVVNFGYSFANATTSTPLSIVLNQQGADHEHLSAVLAKAALVFALVEGLAITGLVTALSKDWLAGVMFGAFSVIASIRWFARSHAYAVHKPKMAALSDIVNSGAMIIASGSLFFIGQITLVEVGLALTIVSFAGSSTVLAVGKAIDLRKMIAAPMKDYLPIWREQAWWALVGVVSTEMTANAHSYIVTLIAGPAAFAPIAVAALCWRPLSTVFTAMTQIERPVIARHLAANDMPKAMKAVKTFSLTVFASLAVNAVAVIVVIAFFLQMLLKGKYDRNSVLASIAIWFVIMIARSIRTPPSILIQAAKEFKKLAHTSIIAAPATLIGATALIFLVSPIASLGGVLLGEIVMTANVLMLARKVRADA